MVNHHDEDESLPLMIDTDAEVEPAAPAGRLHHSDHPDAPLDADDGGNTLQVQDGDSSDGTSRDQRNSKSRTTKWIPYPLRRFGLTVAKWSHGPPNARPYRIRPFFPAVQEFPLRLVERVLPRTKQKFWVIFFYLSIWVIAFVLVKRQSAHVSEIAGWGEPQTVGCGESYWSRDNGCGLDGNDCRPFNGSGFVFRCPARCENMHVLEPRPVGGQEVNYRAFVIGGEPPDDSGSTTAYRGDSYLCGAAIHAGIVSNKNGGCGIVRLVGQQQGFVSSKRNGIESIAFDSYFPLSYEFIPDVSCSAHDSRWSLLAVSTVFSGVLSLFTASPALFFFPNFVGHFWTAGMAMDPPSNKTIAGLFSNVLGKFLPAMFVAWVIYDKMGVRRTLTGLTAQIEKTVLWLGACWVGTLDNYTLDFIPISRLTGHDLQQQPGAKAALAIIVIVLFVVVCSQVWFFRQEARFLKYIKLYAILVLGIVIALTLPGLNLRIHHYVLSLLLLPGTSMQTRPSLLYQGLLVGLFINGIARWGFDSVLQTSTALRGDAPIGTLLPNIHEPTINSGRSDSPWNITFAWDKPDDMAYEGISILVNDVERFRSYFEDTYQKEEFVWSRNGSLGLPEYFRFGFMIGSSSGDYTKAGTWTADGEWEDMKPGPS